MVAFQPPWHVRLLIYLEMSACVQISGNCVIQCVAFQNLGRMERRCDAAATPHSTAFSFSDFTGHSFALHVTPWLLFYRSAAWRGLWTIMHVHYCLFITVRIYRTARVIIPHTHTHSLVHADRLDVRCVCVWGGGLGKGRHSHSISVYHVLSRTNTARAQPSPASGHGLAQEVLHVAHVAVSRCPMHKNMSASNAFIRAVSKPMP